MLLGYMELKLNLGESNLILIICIPRDLELVWRFGYYIDDLPQSCIFKLKETQRELRGNALSCTALSGLRLNLFPFPVLSYHLYITL